LEASKNRLGIGVEIARLFRAFIGLLGHEDIPKGYRLESPQ